MIVFIVLRGLDFDRYFLLSGSKNLLLLTA